MNVDLAATIFGQKKALLTQGSFKKVLMKSVGIVSEKFDFGKVPKIEICMITPEVARDWMGKNIGNRPMYPSNVKKLVTAIKNNKWKMTGDPIRFSDSGKLIDGQHRLQAIIDTGMTVSCIVMHDLGDDIFDVIDSGKPRGKVDVLSIEYGLPIETSGILSTASSLAIDYEREQFHFSGKADKSELINFIDENNEIISSSEYAQKLPKASPVPKSIAAVFHFYASKKNQEAAHKFLDRFMVGALLGPNDNLLHLRNHCTTAKVIRRPVSTTEILWRLIKIWNAEQRGAPIKYFNNTSVRKDESFPKFI